MVQNRRRITFAIALCSCAVLLTEVTLTRIFSVTLMYHYAFLVLSITLFGLGSGGIFHFVYHGLRRRPEATPWLALAAGLALPFCLGLILRLPFSPQIFSAGNMVVLLAIMILASMPFFFAGLFISLLYILNRSSISRLYAADLIGAAVGCMLAVYLIGALGAPLTPLVASLLLILTALITGRTDGKLWFRTELVAALLMIGLLPWTGWLKL